MANKAPRGTIDYEPALLGRINRIIKVVRQQASLMGAEEIETPTMELTKVLLDKYGAEAEEKLIYRIEKLGREELSLRYDLTVPLQRYLAARSLDRMKRFQVGKVYRKDQPYPNRGRFREFIQADLDIVGEYPPMVAEAEILRLITVSLNKLFQHPTLVSETPANAPYVIRINFRDNLWEMLIIALEQELTLEHFKSICVTIDKMDKFPWSKLTDELTEKGLSETSQAKLKSLLDENFVAPKIQSELELLRIYATAMGFSTVIKFDASLARGLDYYTGLIYEVVLAELNPIFCGDEPGETCNPTLIAGGRYDRLIKRHKSYIPAIGVSFGINRLEMALREQMIQNPIPVPEKVYVVSQPEFMAKKLEIVHQLWLRGQPTDYCVQPRKNIKQINEAIKNNYSYVFIYGEDGPDKIKIKRNDHSQDTVVSLDDFFKTFDSV